MRDPAFQTREAIAAARAGRGFEAAAPGLWCCGDLSGLARPASRSSAHEPRHPTGVGSLSRSPRLGRAGCCILSGLALGIDAAGHEGALDAGAPTIGVLGGGHHCFFPRRNRPLAERILAGGGAVLSPYPPDQRAQPWQFLERNGIVAALADAVLLVEAPSRSGALNTAGWAAGRIPVLAVPGDVDRRHVQGCLALIRDGATLARDAGDVLEALGHARPAPIAAVRRAGDSTSSALLQAMEAGAADFDELVAVSGVPASAALASLALLELEGAVESRGAARYARVETPPGGEHHG